MHRRSYKTTNPPGQITTLSLALLLYLLAGQGFRISSSVDYSLASSTADGFATSSHRESAVASLAKQSRIRCKAPRRSVQFGELPLVGMPDVPSICGERSLANVRWQHAITQSLPHDRAPPALTW
jgi:hypothetical protein